MDRFIPLRADLEKSGSQPFALFHKLSLLRAVSKHKYLILAIGLTFSLLTAVGVRMLPSVYTADALVLVDSQKIPESFVSSTVEGELPDRLALISDHIMSSKRLVDAIREFHLYRNTGRGASPDNLVAQMRKDITVSFEKSWTGGRMQAFRLKYQAPDPVVAAEVANWLAKLYVAENAKVRENQASETVDFLNNQLQEAKAGLDEQEKKVAKFKQEHNGTLPEQENSLLATLNSLSVELQGAQASIDRAQESRLSLEAAETAAEASDATMRAGLGALELSQRQGDAAPGRRSEDLERQLRTLRTRYTPEHPAIAALEQEISLAKATEAKELATFKNASEAGPGKSEQGQEMARSLLPTPALVQSRERIAILRSQLQVARREIESLEKQRVGVVSAIADCQSKIQRLPLVQQEMIALTRNYDQSAAAYNSLLQKKLSAGIATDMERSQKSEQFAVIDAARPPRSPVKPKRLLLTSGGVLISFALSLVLVIALEVQKQRFVGEWELPAQVVILGRVPALNAGKNLPGR